MAALLLALPKVSSINGCTVVSCVLLMIISISYELHNSTIMYFVLVHMQFIIPILTAAV